MSVFNRASLEASPLSDLHLIASELGLDGFRRLRKAELVDAILARQGDDGAEAEAPDADDGAEPEEPDADDGADADDEPKAPPRARRSRSRRGRGGGGGGGGRSTSSTRERADTEPAERGGEAASAEGVVELLANGSGFIRTSPPDPSDEDVYISAAQVRRCELVSGDRVTGPVRPARRSERFPSLVRVDTINGSPADEVAAGTRYDELPASFATEKFQLGSDDETLKAIEWLTPIGRGSRVVFAGGPRSGKTEALRRLAGALAGVEGVDAVVVLAGVRPEEITEWETGPARLAGTAGLAASADTQAQTIERAVDEGKRIAARGGHVVVLVDTLDGVNAPAARRTLAAARNIADGGSLTIVATAAQPVGGETTVVTFDAGLAETRRFPAIDLRHSGTIRPELLVGSDGADAIAKARTEAYG